MTESHAGSHHKRATDAGTDARLATSMALAAKRRDNQRKKPPNDSISQVWRQQERRIVPLTMRPN